MDFQLPTSSLPACLTLAPAAFLATRPHIDRLMAACMVVRPGARAGEAAQTLLLRRAAGASYGACWEVPGGCVDGRRDASVLAAATRELHEETALLVRRVRCVVGLARDDALAQPTGLGIAPDDERAVEEAGDEARTVTFDEAGRRWAKVTLLVSVRQGVVRLAPDEHDAWAWVTEDEVRRDAGTWRFTSEGVWRTVLEGFRLAREMGADDDDDDDDE